MQGLFDSHCHLYDEQFQADREELLRSLPAQGLAYCVTVGGDLESSLDCIQMAQAHDYLYATAGVHPHVAAQAPKDYLVRLHELLGMPKVVALGEAGLDYHYDFSPREAQQRALQEQLDLAHAMGLPIVLHVREAHGDLLSILRARKGRHAGGIIHCFSGSAESAREYEALGFVISFAGSVTFRNAAKLQAAAQAVSLENLLIETDSPYLAPVPMRGRRNNPAHVGLVCQFLAELRGVDAQQMADLTRENAKRVYRIP